MGTYRYIGTPALEARAMQALEQAVNTSAHLLANEARAVAHVDTGAERGGIHAEPATPSGRGVKAVVRSSEPYDVFQHEGFRGVAGTKFLEHPLLANAPRFREAIRRAASSRL